MKDISIIFLINYAQIFIVMGQLPRARIYGGRLAVESQFPYQISLQRNEIHICGGTILTQLFVVTASVCITRKDRKFDSPRDYTVIAGSNYVKKGGYHFQPEKFFIREKYNSYDVILIQLKTPFPCDKNIQPIPIYGKELHKNDVVTITGWGATDKSQILSDELQYHYSVVNSPEDCKKFNPGRYYEGILCLSHARYGGACTGDIGGPATFQGKLVGIASFILTACGSDKPNGFIKVSYFLDWINKYIY